MKSNYKYKNTLFSNRQIYGFLTGVVFLLLFILTSTSLAQAKQNLTIDECLDVALYKDETETFKYVNPSLQKAYFELKSQEEQIIQKLSNYYPDISLKSDWSRNGLPL